MTIRLYEVAVPPAPKWSLDLNIFKHSGRIIKSVLSNPPHADRSDNPRLDYCLGADFGNLAAWITRALSQGGMSKRNTSGRS
jgi:hypothetical protein